ncbi:hypothetical protein [Micromonospora globbae]|uniref:Uncharacterized protein n=1 Tax=Micromonospora globbae TaxID=1894969 RepID=A0A420F7M4_9ACTN|nr:hypothetical protein [Micromonospora globbae]RKF28933.1 hypothetical protein D7I43_04210 [Micromonospora globbae]WTF83727.1 hypothetical protein OH732_18375 [Micromonospora globbae]
MLWWIVLAVVLATLVVLAVAVRGVLSRLPGLRRAAVALQRRQAEAQELAGAATALQERAEALQDQLATAQRRIELIKAKRGG